MQHTPEKEVHKNIWLLLFALHWNILCVFLVKFSPLVFDNIFIGILHVPFKVCYMTISLQIIKHAR